MTVTTEQIQKIYRNSNELRQIIDTISNEGPGAARKMLQEVYTEEYAKAVVANVGQRMMEKNLSN